MELNTIDFESVINDIESEKCILLLGPEVVLSQNGNSLQKELVAYFAQQPQLNIEFDNDGLAVFKEKNGQTKRSFHTHFRKFYDQNVHVSDFYKKIVQIPFHLFVTISPDMNLNKAFDSFGFPYDFKYYRKSEPCEVINNIPTKYNPLIYNLFGIYTDEDSLVATQDDIIEFLFSILGDFKTPQTLRSGIKKAKTFFFLGFDFEKWYLKIILKLMELETETANYASEKPIDFDFKTKAFYINNFKMAFVKSNAFDFIDNLYNELKKRDKIKKFDNENEHPLKAKIKNHLKNDDLQNAIDELSDYFEGKSEDLSGQLIQASGRLNGLKRKINNKTISAETAEVEMNQIRQHIISLIDEIQ